MPPTIGANEEGQSSMGSGYAPSSRLNHSRSQKSVVPEAGQRPVVGDQRSLRPARCGKKGRAAPCETVAEHQPDASAGVQMRQGTVIQAAGEEQIVRRRFARLPANPRIGAAQAVPPQI